MAEERGLGWRRCYMVYGVYDMLVGIDVATDAVKGLDGVGCVVDDIEKKLELTEMLID